MFPQKILRCLIVQDAYAKAEMKMVVLFIKFMTPRQEKRNF